MIRSLNLDGMFLPTTHPEIHYELFKFSGGELHIKLKNGFDYKEVEKVVITQRIKNSDDLMAILFAVDALKLNGVKAFDLVIPYIPYARQDRKCVYGESFTLKVFTTLINTVGFEKVYVFDAHSDVSVALINNCENVSNEDYVIRAIMDLPNDTYLISPDSGANKKINKLYDSIKNEFLAAKTPNPILGVVKCDKVRNMHTGQLSDFTAFTDDLNGADCLIVDDICDGGRTFIGVAKALKEKNAGNISLFVTHGIFSWGFAEIFKEIDRVYTTNSFNDANVDGKLNADIKYLKQYKLYL